MPPFNKQFRIKTNIPKKTSRIISKKQSARPLSIFTIPSMCKSSFCVMSGVCVRAHPARWLMVIITGDHGRKSPVKVRNTACVRPEYKSPEERIERHHLSVVHGVPGYRDEAFRGEYLLGGSVTCVRWWENATHCSAPGQPPGCSDCLLVNGKCYGCSVSLFLQMFCLVQYGPLVFLANFDYSSWHNPLVRTNTFCWLNHISLTL